MLLKLYLLGAALAFMPLSTQPDEVHRMDLFPNIPEDVNGTTFPFDIKVINSSDIVLVKCPNAGYRHTSTNDKFSNSMDILSLENIKIQYAKLLSVWFPLLRNASGSTHINCGEVTIKSNGIPPKSLDWTYNVNWNNSLTDIVRETLTYVDSTVPKSSIDCINDEDRTVIFTKNKENDVVLKVDPNMVEKPYVNQLFYYFVKPDEIDKELFKKPCAILKGFRSCPSFALQKEGFSSLVISNSNMTIVEVSGKTEKINVILKQKNDIEYYRGEKISLSKMRYKEGGHEEIKNSNITLTSKFSIEGYDLVKLTYICPNGGNPTMISQKYYFAPTSKDLKIKEETVTYTNNDTSTKPNCPLFYLNIGYLYKFKHNETEKDYSNLAPIGTIKEISSKTESHIFFKGIEDPHLTIKCFYKTPDGNITTITEFIDKDMVAAIQEEERRRVLEEERQRNQTQQSQIDAFRKDIEKTEEKGKKIEEEKKKIEEKLQKSNMSLFQKLSDKVGKGNAIFLVAALILFILIILAVLIVFVYKKWLSPYLIMLKQKRKYPNVYVFWDTLTSQPFDNYCKAIKEKKYLSNKVLNQIVVKKMEGGEEVDVGVSHLFDQTLVKCYRRFPRKIKAHYIYTDIEKRKYILSDGLTKDTQSTFWQMVYEEDIGTIVAIIYDTKSLDVDEYPDDIYWKWKTKKRVFGKVIVTRLEEIKVNALFVTGQKILLEKDGGETKNLEIYHVSNWKENDIPQSDLQFVNMYQEIIKDSQKKNILIHSPEGTGARVYMFTYFACIYDALKTDNDTDCPLKIIKMMREQRYGGNIVPYEFAYVIKALVTNFFNNKILVDFSSRRADFYSSYDTYFYDYLRRQAKMDENVKKFLDFVNIVDEGKIYEYKSVFDTLGRMDPDILPEYSKRFQNAVKNHKEGKDKKRFRYSDIPCIDANGITINGKPEDDKESFIHANKFEYKTVNGTRKLILCQAPTEDTRDDMLDMILRYKVSLIVILVKPEEAIGPQKKWVPYYPTEHYELDTPNFTLLRIMLNKLDENFIVQSRYQVRSKKTNEAVAFDVLHYQGWPDTSIPSEHKSVYGLYKKIVSLRTDDYVVIHCSAGIGRTGTLALIMYLIDTINYFPTFDPITRLKCLREHRYLAVQKHNQFVFALLVVFEHYKKEIDEMDAEAYEKFMTMAEKLFNKEKKRQDKTKE
uniref:Tyrosine-protein phosphatase domain-containing protein n=1 Tax=Strongyloides papillosus TaxID=174720 RepID=A0A0N5C718_STREA